MIWGKPQTAAARPEWRGIILDAVVIFLLTAALILPLFQMEYMENWASIESTFIADSRFLVEHWPHPNWQPLWYLGTRWDYIYPPALRYGSAILARSLGVSTARGYHLYISFFYCLGIAGVYLLVRLGSGSRGAAWLAAAGAALLSPGYLFHKDIRVDAAAARLWPQRINVLVRYGEGPHMTAVAMLGLALAACWRALQRPRPIALAMAGVCSALVVSNNFYGATALAILFPPLVWSLWVTHQDRRMWLRAAAIAALAYGLTAFWLVPSYLRVTLDNMKLVSHPGNRWSVWLALAVALLYGWLSWRLGRGRPGRAWPLYTAGILAFMSLNVLGQHYFKFRVMGEPERMVPELDLVMILASVEALRHLWNAKPSFGLNWLKLRPWVVRLCLVLAVVAAFRPARRYLRHPWGEFVTAKDYTQRIEYRITSWLKQNAPDLRVAANGSVRFWFNAWHDLAQLGGGSEQGVLNQLVIPPQWEIAGGPAAEPAILWLKCLGVDAVGVHQAPTQEVYRDVEHPKKFAGVLPVLWESGQGDTLYRIPRRFPGIARVVDASRAGSLRPFTSLDPIEPLRMYADWVENGPDSPARTRWEGADVLHVQASVKAGQAILVQATYDPCWQAHSAGRRLPIRKDVMGLMLIEAPPGDHDLKLVFELPLENQVGRIVTLLTMATMLGLVIAGLKPRSG